MMKRKKLLTAPLCLLLALALSLPALAAGRYGDVTEDAWYAEAVDYCAENALMNGVGGDRFDPGALVSRAMTVTVLHRLADTPAPSARGAFRDVPADEWYSEAADWAAEAGIAGGVGGGRFAPTDAVTRQDLAVFLWRLVGSPAAEQPSAFTDEADLSDYALTAVRWASGAGIINGVGDGRFLPRDSATRAELAAILMRLHRSGMLTRTDSIEALRAPCGIVADADGSLLVTDTYYKRVWRIRDGRITAFAGADSIKDVYGQPLGGYRDSYRAWSLFTEPWAITPFLDGWAVSDPGNNALRLITEAQVRTINGAPGEAGLEASEMGVTYDRPTGLATDNDGSLYVADTGSGTIRRITVDGIVTIFARDLSEPTGICWYDGSLYVAETGENRILRITNGSVQVLAGSGEEEYVDGDALSACFRSPTGVTVGPDGTVYVADTVNSAVRSISGGVVRTLFRGDGDPYSLISPVGMIVQDGALWVCDNFNGALHVVPLG